MTVASRIILAKELFRCARMVLDASCHKEAKEIKAGDNASIIRNAVEHYLPEIKEEAKKHISLVKYVYHHLKGNSTKKFIGTGAPNLENKELVLDAKHALMLNSSNDMDKRMVMNYIKKNQNRKRNPRKYVTEEYLQKINNEIKDEVDGCVILPKRFHDWLHKQTDKGEGMYEIKSTKEILDLSSRNACYQLLHRYTKDEKELSELIKNDFVDSDLQSAIVSLNDIISLSSIDEQIIIRKLHRIYNTIKKQLLEKNIANDET